MGKGVHSSSQCLSEKEDTSLNDSSKTKK